MKRSELAFSALLVPVDILMLLAAASVAYYLRFTALTDIRPVLYELPFGEFARIIVLVLVGWIAIFAMSGLYAFRATRRAVDEIAKIFLACSTGFVLIVLLTFFNRDLFSSRFIILAGWVLAMLFVSFGRLVVRAIQHAFFRKGIGVHQIVVVGSDQTTEDLIGYLATNKLLGFKVVQRLDDASDAALATLAEKRALLHFDEIVIADPQLDRAHRQRLLDFAAQHHIIFKYAADIFDAQVSNIDISAIGGVPILEIRRTALDGWGRILKRVFDAVFGTLLLTILSPVFVVTAIAVKLDSEGSVFLSLQRIGEKGKPFVVYKFRSMVKNAQALKQNLVALNERGDGPLFKIKNDPRVTRVGRFIRRFSIDELPQLWNVIRGQMSLVGPRPHEPEEVAKYEKHHLKLLEIKPGITGMAQISGRSDLSFEEEVRLDTFYIENWSLRIDLQILLRTPLVVLAAKSAS
ncbi:MAG: sugar transferase [Candidatus Kerfeldbacteria bacterium]|nr:sugar transferase [Candidatus Kerfeldbacteria bacterium]